MASSSNSSANKLFGLDLLRALAITLVFFYHYGGQFAHPDWVHDISRFGWTGVDLFFVLSGFLIASQLFKTIASGDQVSLRTFFIKRIFRIIPLYLIIVAAYFLFPFVREREGLAPLWKYLTFTQNFGLDLRTQGAFSHAWSLCIEEQFYLALPFLLVVLVYFKFLKRSYLLLAAIFLFGFLIRIYSWDKMVIPYEDDDLFGVYWIKWIYYPTYCRLDGLLVGVSIAALFQFKPRVKNWLQQFGNWIILLSMGVLTVAYFVCEDQQSFGASIFGFPLAALGYGLLVIGAVSPASFLYKVKAKAIGNIATFSYAIYLSHKIVIHITQKLLPDSVVKTDGNLMMIICIVNSILVAFILHQLIERPMLKLRNYITMPAPSQREKE